MKNIIVIVVFVFSLVFSCKVAEKRVYYRIQKIDKIYYDLFFSDEARVNGKIFIDNTEDLDIIIGLYDKQKKRAEENKKNKEKALKNIVVKKELDSTDDDLRDNSSDGVTENVKDSSTDEIVDTNRDNTGDRLDENSDSFNDASSDMKDKSSSRKDLTDDTDYTVYLLNKNRVNYYKTKNNFLRNNLFNKLAAVLTKLKIELADANDLGDNTKDALILKIETIDYDEGEFNLIKNLPTRIGVLVSLIEGGKKTSFFKKWYTVKSLLEYPTENSRLSNAAASMTEDIINLLNDSSVNKFNKKDKKLDKKEDKTNKVDNKKDNTDDSIKIIDQSSDSK